MSKKFRDYIDNIVFLNIFIFTIFLNKINIKKKLLI